MALNGLSSRGANPQIDGAINVRDRFSTFSNVRDGNPDISYTNGGHGGALLQPRYPHIKDLQAKADAAIRELSAVMPV